MVKENKHPWREIMMKKIGYEEPWKENRENFNSPSFNIKLIMKAKKWHVKMVAPQ